MRPRRLPAALVLSALAACTPSFEPVDGATVADVLAAAEPPTDPVARAVAPVGAARDEIEVRADGSRWRCAVQSYEGLAVVESFLPAAGAAGVWPGNLVAYDGAASGDPLAIPLERGPGALLVEAPAARPAGAEALPTVTQEAIEAARGRLLVAIDGARVEGFDAGIHEAQSLAQLAAALGTTTGQLDEAVGRPIELAAGGPYVRYAVRLAQPFYTLRFAAPPEPAASFGPSVGGDDVAAYVAPGSPPAYVASVVYGREFLVLVESELPEPEVRAAFEALLVGLDAATPAGVVAAVHLNAEARVRAFVVGGGGDPELDAALAAPAGPLLGLRELAGARVTLGPHRPGTPIAYSARYLADGRTLRAGVPASYDERACSQYDAAPP